MKNLIQNNLILFITFLTFTSSSFSQTHNLTLSILDRNSNSIKSANVYLMVKNAKTNRYDTIRKKLNVSDSSIIFKDLEENNYLLLVSGAAEKIVPTYYGGVFHWEEAEKNLIKLDN